MIIDVDTQKEVWFANVNEKGEVTTQGHLETRTGYLKRDPKDVDFDHPLGKVYIPYNKTKEMTALVRELGGTITTKYESANTLLAPFDILEQTSRTAMALESPTRIVIIGCKNITPTFYKDVVKGVGKYYNESFKDVGHGVRFRIFNKQECCYLDAINDGKNCVTVMSLGLRRVEKQPIITKEQLDSVVPMLTSSDPDTVNMGLEFLASFNYHATFCLGLFLLDIISKNKYDNIQDVTDYDTGYKFMQKFFSMYKSKRDMRLYTDLILQTAKPVDKILCIHLAQHFPNECEGLINLAELLESK